jgi:hypothetical protein
MKKMVILFQNHNKKLYMTFKDKRKSPNFVKFPNIEAIGWVSTL